MSTVRLQPAVSVGGDRDRVQSPPARPLSTPYGKASMAALDPGRVHVTDLNGFEIDGGIFVGNVTLSRRGSAWVVSECAFFRADRHAMETSKEATAGKRLSESLAGALSDFISDNSTEAALMFAEAGVPSRRRVL